VSHCTQQSTVRQRDSTSRNSLRESNSSQISSDWNFTRASHRYHPLRICSEFLLVPPLFYLISTNRSSVIAEEPRSRRGQGAVKALDQTCRYLYWESRMSPSPHDRSSTTHLFDSTEENYTTSLMGIDVTGSQVEERTALLDSNNRVHYSGTTTPTRMCFSSC